MNPRLGCAIGAAIALLSACARPDGPGEPVWGKEPCAHCAMVLSDKRFGAQLLTEGGERFYFDDVGCLIVFTEERHVPTFRAWVYVAPRGLWLDARTAHYAGGAASPMDFGFEATDGAGASWDEMRQRVLAKRGRAS